MKKEAKLNEQEKGHIVNHKRKYFRINNNDNHHTDNIKSKSIKIIITKVSGRHEKYT